MVGSAALDVTIEFWSDPTWRSRVRVGLIRYFSTFTQIWKTFWLGKMIACATARMYPLSVQHMYASLTPTAGAPDRVVVQFPDGGVLHLNK